MRHYRSLFLIYGLSQFLAWGESSPFGLKPNDLGIQLMPYGTRERAMGSSGMASEDPGVAPLNHSRQAFSRQTTFSATFEGDVDYLRDEATSNRTGSFALPLIGMDFHAGKLGNFGVSYWQRFSREFSFSPMENEGNVRQNLQFEGGLHELVTAWAFPIGNRIAIGAGYHWLIGRERSIFASEFTGIGDGSRNLTGDTLQVKSSGGYPALSAMFRHRLFNLAGSVSAGADLTQKRKRSITGVETPDWLEFEKEFPWSFALGTAYKLSPNKVLTADYSSLLFEVNGDVNPSHLVGFGFEKVGTGGLYDPYHKKIALRGGVGYEYLSLDAANHYFLAVGTGLPLGRRGGNLNVAVAYGHRGSTEINLISEDYVKLSLSLTGVGNWGRSSRNSR